MQECNFRSTVALDRRFPLDLKRFYILEINTCEVNIHQALHFAVRIQLNSCVLIQNHNFV